MSMIKKAFGGTLLGATLLLTSGCVYSSVKIPLDIDLNQTQLGTKVGESTSKSVLWAVAWGDSGMQAAAENGGITTLLHADQKIYTILFGLYSKQTTVVYGD